MKVNRTKVSPDDWTGLNREIDNLRNAIETLNIFYGAGSPENVVSAPFGSVYSNVNGGVSETLYIKERNDNESSGWTALNGISPYELTNFSFTVDASAKTLDIAVTKPFRMNLPDPKNPGSYVDTLVSTPGTIYGGTHTSENFNLGAAGQTLAVAWGNSYPLTWYVTVFGGEMYWVASRNPAMKVIPAAANNIGDFDAAPVTSAQENAFVAASITQSDFVGLPVWPIGTIPVTRAAASAIPTLAALSAGIDGPGLWNEDTIWTFPASQNGNFTNYYWDSDGSHDIPTYATPGNIIAKYKSFRSGEYLYILTTRDAGACAQDGGAGNIDIFFYLPAAIAPGVSGAASGGWPAGGATMNGVISILTARDDSDDLSRVVCGYVNSATGGNVRENVWGDNANDDIMMMVRYPAFEN